MTRSLRRLLIVIAGIAAACSDELPTIIRAPQTELNNQVFEWKDTVENRLDGTYGQYEAPLEANRTYLFQTTHASGGEADTYLYLLDANLQLITQNDDGLAGKQSLIVFTAPKTASYYLRLRAHTKGQSGTCALQMRTTTIPKILRPEESLTSQYFDWHDANTTSLEGTYGQYQLPLTGGTDYTIETSDTVGKGDDTYLFLLDSDFQLLTSDDDSAGGGNSRIRYTPPVSGSYYLRLRGFSKEESGTCTLRLATSTPLTISPGQNMSRLPLEWHPAFVDRAEGRYGEVATTVDTDVPYAAILRPSTSDKDGYLYLRNSSDALLASNDNINETDRRSMIIFYPDPNEHYFLRIRSAIQSQIGQAELALYDLSPNRLDPGDLLPLQPVAWRSVEAMRQSGIYGQYSLQLTAGASYTFETSGSTGVNSDTVIYLLDSTWQIVAQDDDAGEGAHSRLTTVAPSHGSYYLRVRAYSKGDSGSCSVAMNGPTIALHPGDSLDNQPMKWPYPYAKREDGTYGQYLVDLTAGVSYAFTTANASDYSDSYLLLLDENAQIVARDDDSGDGSMAKLTYTPQTSGTYSLRLRAYAQGRNGLCTLRMAQL